MMESLPPKIERIHEIIFHNVGHKKTLQTESTRFSQTKWASQPPFEISCKLPNVDVPYKVSVTSTMFDNEMAMARALAAALLLF